MATPAAAEPTVKNIWVSKPKPPKPSKRPDPPAQKLRRPEPEGYREVFAASREAWDKEMAMTEAAKNLAPASSPSDPPLDVTPAPAIVAAHLREIARAGQDYADAAAANAPPEIQFDPRFHGGSATSTGKRAKDSDDLRRLFGTTDGFQVRKERRPRRRTISPWSGNEKALLKKILRDRNVVRDFTIGRLYYCCGWTSPQIAVEMGMTQGAVKRVLNRLKDTDPYPHRPL